MKKKIFLLGSFLFCGVLFSQVGINTETPKATLDVESSAEDLTSTDGIIAPRLTGNQLKAKDALYTSELEGTIIYATSAAIPSSTKTINVTQEGYYYFDGEKWMNFSSGNGAGEDISIYKNDGSLTSNRFANLNGFNLSFNGDGNLGVGAVTPTQKLDVIGNVRFREVPNSTTLANTDQVMVLESNGTGKKVNVTTLKNVIDTNTNIYTNNGTLNANRIVSLAGNNLMFNGEGNIGIGTNPTQKIDVNGTARLRNVPNGADSDQLLVINSNGVIRKRSLDLPPSPSFVMYVSTNRTINHSANNNSNPLNFNVTNKIYSDYIEKVSGNTYRVKKSGVYVIDIWAKYSNIPLAENNGDGRTGCSLALLTSDNVFTEYGIRMHTGSGSANINRSIILNVNESFNVVTSCNRSGSQYYSTASGSTLFVTYQPL